MTQTKAAHASRRAPTGRAALGLLSMTLVLASSIAFAQTAWAADAASAVAPVCSATPRAASPAYLARILAIARELGVATDYPARHSLRPQLPAKTLTKAGVDVRGRTTRLAPRAAAALRAMIAAASRDGLVLQIVSGFRSVAYQRALVEAKLQRGLSLDDALRINTAPGFSEHHSGCAIDLTTPNVAPAETGFADTRAYEWLQQHAGEYGFHLSYPPDNEHGIAFEPWHWRYVVDDHADAGSAEITPSEASADGG